MAKYILFLFTLLLPITIFSQTIANPYTSTEERFKSPQIHLLKEFVDHPVDLSRGLVDVSVPIYDIQFDDKTIPVSLMFHASGLKADVTENGMLGLKWALNAGGFISREVRGYPDERRPHKTIPGLWYTPDWMTLYGGAGDKGYFNNNPIFEGLGLPDLGNYLGSDYNGKRGKYEDTEYDIFTFSLPNGQSGKFILKDDNGIKSASFMPYKAYKLNSQPVVEYGVYNKLAYIKFEIVDDQGYIYCFGTSNSGKAYYEYTTNYDYINSWHLTSITSPNKKDIITFDYLKTSIITKSELVPVVINDKLDNFVNYFNMENCPGATYNSSLFNALESIIHNSRRYFVENYNVYPYIRDETCYLSKITYNNLNVDFSYNENTGDVNLLILSNIKVFADNKIIRKAEFDVHLSENPIGGSSPNPSYLNAVNIKGSTNEIIEKYSFDYYYFDKIPSVDKLSNRADYWGYYNSQVENVIQKDTAEIFFTIPSCMGNTSQIFQREIGSGNNRYSNGEDMKIGMIKSITYPTGGTTTFDYEANRYKNDDITKECGGLRIKSVIDKDRNGKELKKRTFTYGENEDGIGKIPPYLKPDRILFNAFEEKQTTYYIKDNRIFLDSSGMPYWFNDFGEGSYRTRYITGFFPGSFYTFLYNLVSYDKVTEYYGDSSNNIGKIENYYETNSPVRNDYEFDTRFFEFQKDKIAVDPSNFWYGNKIYKKIEYKIENRLYYRVKQTDYTYVPKIVDEFVDLSIFKFQDFIGYDLKDGKPSIRTATEELERIINNPGSFFGYKAQKYTIGSEILSSVREESFFKNGKSIVQTITNTYDNNKATFLKESTTTSSKGENLTQKFLYPFNINTGVYSQMTQANVISPLIEKVALKGDKVTGSALLTYKKSDDNFVPDQNLMTELSIPVPYSGFMNFNGSGKDLHYNANPEITYDLYDDYGNPKQITSKGKITTCYVWGYDKKYPIAKIENAAYTAGLPNSITPTQQTLIDNAISATVSETTLLTEANLITKLQLLREGFPIAMVSTYTYDPLIGITSITDPRGYTTYYEYDVFGRLKQVKDKESKILSSNNYHYRN
ncbi:RHS repeat protein [Flavobacterium sp. N1736]|uniref:RHS repeat protein n=1 Tax=Flavobacterium sp. N1736 TaxID=2986823 RepID=UPI0022240065|nr:RHS repeat domain-containing protein [Flavobacterium sp. N1736]